MFWAARNETQLVIFRERKSPQSGGLVAGAAIGTDWLRR